MRSPGGSARPRGGTRLGRESGGEYLGDEISQGDWASRHDRYATPWLQAKYDIAEVAVRHGGSISACHGACRAGDVDLVPLELGGQFEVMKKIKRLLDPLNVMNPGKYLLDRAYEETEEA